MAQSLTVTTSAFATNTSVGGFVWTLPAPNFSSMTLSGNGFTAGQQTIGTTAEDLTYLDIAAASVGWLFMRNLDATNYVQWGYDDAATFRPVGRLAINEPWTCLRVDASVQIMLKANTASCKVEYYLLQT